MGSDSRENISQTDWGGFLVLERMVNDIHTIRSASDISSASSNQLTFTDINNSSVQYEISDSALIRNSQTLATGVQNFNLSYLDKNGASTSTTSAIRYILISLTLTHNNFAQSFSTLAATRGMM